MAAADAQAGPLVAVSVALVVASLAYFAFLEGGSGATLGKRLFGLRVVDRETGRPIGYSRALIRTFARILSAAPFDLGFLWPLIDAQGRAWHDILSGSLVVATAEMAPG